MTHIVLAASIAANIYFAIRCLILKKRRRRLGYLHEEERIHSAEQERDGRVHPRSVYCNMQGGNGQEKEIKWKSKFLRIRSSVQSEQRY